MFQPFTFHVGLSSICFVSGEIVFAEIAKTELLKRFPNRNNVIKSPTNAERTLLDLTPQRFSIPRLPTLKQASKQASKQYQLTNTNYFLKRVVNPRLAVPFVDGVFLMVENLFEGGMNLCQKRVEKRIYRKALK